jgi:hypothetical protein
LQIYYFFIKGEEKMVKVTLITNNPRKTVFAEETKTVKQILDENDVSYGNAATAVDGATLNAGEINKTLDELGIKEKVVISVLAHKDNAAKATIQGAACVITSSMTPEQIQRYKKFHPESLTMYDEDNEPVYAISYDPEGPGSIDCNGAIFGAATNAEGFATITVVLDPTAEDKQQLVFDKLGRALLNLNDLEKQLLENISDLDEEEAAIRAAITSL